MVTEVTYPLLWGTKTANCWIFPWERRRLQLMSHSTRIIRECSGFFSIRLARFEKEENKEIKKKSYREKLNLESLDCRINAIQVH